jgi:cell division protein ZapE
MAKLLQKYNEAVSSGGLEDDAAQRGLVKRLDTLAATLAGYERKFFKKLFQASPPGLYICGQVGRGKTMLMDLFFDEIRMSRKRRVHFHAFMRDVHERIFQERKKSEGDALVKIANDIADESKLLCFDEFAVTDVADAMILSRLFSQLFSKGMVVVATSNQPPEELYKNGLNRPLFEPFITLVREKMDVVELEAKKDFRLEQLEKSGVYFTGIDAAQKFNAVWENWLQGRDEQQENLHFKGRTLHVPRAVADACRFTFAQLCEAERSADDYLELAAEFQAIFLETVPCFDFDNRNALRRFISLIDILYDRGVKLIASAAAEPSALIANMDGYESQAYARTASRLIEMRSEAYLKRRHLPEGA